jgi:type IV secretion system protein VirB6
MASTIVSSMLNKVDTTALNFLNEKSALVSAALDPVVRNGIILFTGLWGLALLWQLIDEPLMDGIRRLVKIAIVGGFAVSAGLYMNVIATPIYQTGSELGAVIMGGGATSATVLDTAIDKGAELYMKFESQQASAGFVEGIILGIESMIVFGGVLLVVLGGLIITILAKLGLAMVLIFGPIVVLCLLFDATKNFFTSWLGLSLNYVALAALAAAGVAILIAWLNSSMVTALNPAVPVSLVSLAETVLIGGLAIALFWNSPAMASSLAGGMQLSTLGSGMASARASRGFARELRPSTMQQHVRGVQRDFAAVKSAARVATNPAASSAKWIANRIRPGSTNQKAA